MHCIWHNRCRRHLVKLPPSQRAIGQTADEEAQGECPRCRWSHAHHCQSASSDKPRGVLRGERWSSFFDPLERPAGLSAGETLHQQKTQETQQKRDTASANEDTNTAQRKP